MYLSSGSPWTAIEGHPELPSFCFFLSIGCYILPPSLWVIFASFQYIYAFFIPSLVRASKMLTNNSPKFHNQFRSTLMPPVVGLSFTLFCQVRLCISAGVCASAFLPTHVASGLDPSFSSSLLTGLPVSGFLSLFLHCYNCFCFCYYHMKQKNTAMIMPFLPQNIH